MMYRIARAGQVFGPYSEADVIRYLATGNIVPSDLAQVEGNEDWVPVEQLFPSAAAGGATSPPLAAAPVAAAVAMPLYPDPPDFPWWAVLLLGFFTGGLFAVFWDVWESAWLRRIDHNSVAIWFYIADAIVYCFRLPQIYHTVWYNVSGTTVVFATPYSHFFGALAFLLFFLTRFVFRSELLRHFNGPEPLGLRLNWFWTLIFGGVYFQYKFNEINAVKRAMRISVP